MALQKGSILVVDDEADIREAMHDVLSNEYDVLLAENGAQAIEISRAQRPLAVFLDVRMPEVDGLLVCDQLRADARTRHIPILFISGYCSTEERVRAFERGGDDFIPKPFSMEEIQVRLKAKLRRQTTGSIPDLLPPLTLGNLSLDLNRLELRVRTHVIPVSVLEFNLLRFLVENCERVLSRQQILDAIWNDSVVSERTVDTHIGLLRKKLKDSDIKVSTVYGAGYILRPEEY